MPAASGVTVRVHETRPRGRYDTRDRLGHFVRKPPGELAQCPHKCCRNRRRHPDRMPTEFDHGVLRSMSTAELEEHIVGYTGFSRRKQDTRQKAFLQIIAEATRREKQEKTRERAKQRRESANQEYRDEVYRQTIMAENATNGYMLNKAGKKAGIDPVSLFTGPESRVAKYASPELIEWFENNPRPTRASWFGSAKSRREHLSGRRIG